MPKVKLGRNPTLERQEATRKVIRRAMAERGICSQRELAQKMGETENAKNLVSRVNQAHYGLDMDQLVVTVQKMADVMTKILEREARNENSK